MTPRIACAALVAALVAASCGAPRAPRGIPRQIVPAVETDRAPIVDVLHYDIEVDLDHEAGFVDGVLGVRFAGLPGVASDRLVLDAAEMSIDAVYDELGDDMLYGYDGELLVIDLGAPLAAGAEREVSIEYSCFPRRGLFFVGPSGRDPRPWHVWSQGQAEDTRHWIPCWDAPNDMATHELAVTVDAGFATMAAGELTSSKVSSRTGKRTDAYRMDVPHVSYLITLVAGGFATGALDAPTTGLDLPFLVEPRHAEQAAANLAQTDTLIAVIAEDVATPYPHGKYAQCCVKEYTAGGMENISATTLYYEGVHHPQDDPQYDERDLVAHEIAHQWFGDLVTCASWTDLWLNEGFATYYENVAVSAVDGDDVYRHNLQRNQRAMGRAERADSRPIVWAGWDLPDDTFATHAYEGGATRLHLLRTILGEGPFRAAVNRYLREHGGRVVTTADLQASFEEATGVDLQRFFDEWLYDGGYPEMYGTVVEGRLVLEQVQRARGWREVFHAPLTITWSRGGVERTKVVELDAREQRVTLEGDGDVDWVALNSDTSLPCRAWMMQDEDAYRRQLLGASSMVARLTAAQWFLQDAEVRSQPLTPLPRLEPWLPSVESHDALAVVARDPDAFWALRTTALAAMADEARSTLLEELVYDADPRVREAAMTHLATSPNDYAVPLLADGLLDDNASVVAAALGSLALRGHPSVPAWADELLAEDDELRWRRDRVVVDALALYDGVDDQIDPDVTRRLVAIVRSHAVPRVRSRALAYLARRDDGPHAEVVWRELAAALHDESFVVRAAAAGGLERWGDRRALEHLRARGDIEPDPSVLAAIRDAITALD